MCIQRAKDDSSRTIIIGYNKLLAYQEFSAKFSTLKIRDNKIVERDILVSGDWDPGFLWVFIYETISHSVSKERIYSSI